MANCEEESCENVQSAICLHCNRRLCAPHIVTHGTVLLSEADELCEQINKVAEQLSVCLQGIKLKRNEAVDALDVWRQREINKIEDKYAEKIQAIESKQDYFVDLENEFSQRLAKEAKDPLQRMQIQKSANSQLIQSIRQTLSDIKQKSIQLDWNSMETVEQSSGLNHESTKINTLQEYTHENNLSKTWVGQHGPIYAALQQYYPRYQVNNSAVEHYSPSVHVLPATNTSVNGPHPHMNSSGFVPIIRPQYEYGQTGASPRNYRPQPTEAFAVPTSQYWRPQSAASGTPPFTSFSQSLPIVFTDSQIDIKRLPTNSCKELISLFMNVSSANDHYLYIFINNKLTQATHVNNVMIVLLSFLEAWHLKTSPAVFNERVLAYHIFTVQKYIHGRDHELTVIAAILAFINSCDYDDIKSGRIMNILLHQFFNHKCLSKATLLDWYENGASYGYNNFARTKQWAKPFIDQLNTMTQQQ